MPASIAPIELTRSHSIRQPSGLRYGNFEGVIHLPPVTVNGRHGDYSSLNNQQINRTVCDWFDTWQPWQQRVCLAGIANRCSAHHLDILATTLEPVRHRDYATASHQRYPSASFRRVQEIHRIHVDRKKKKSPRAKKSKPAPTTCVTPQAVSREKAQTPPSSHSERRSRKQSRANSKVSFADEVHEGEKPEKKPEPLMTIDLFADQMSGNIMESAMKEASAILKIEKRDFTSSKTKESEDSENVNQDGEDLNQNSHEPGDNEDNQSENLDEKYADIESIDSDVENNAVARELDDEDEDEHSLTETPKQEDGQSKPQAPVDKSVLKKYMKKKGQRKATKQPVVVQRSASIKSSRSSRRTSSSQFRRSVFGSSAATTLEYFSPRQAIGGTLLREIRHGPVQRPVGLEDIPVPLAKSYKSTKWWTDTHDAGKTFKKAKRSDLSGNFRDQLNQIWEWLTLWEDFERIALLREVVKICSDVILEYLVAFINQKIREETDINRLMDRTLLYIFSLLKPHEIDVVSQVCRRWRFLCATDDLWKLQCMELGEIEGVADITGLVVGATSPGRGVDWKLAYLELKQLLYTMKQGLAVPQDLQLDEDQSSSKRKGDTKKLLEMKRGHEAPKARLSGGEPMRSRQREVTIGGKSTDDYFSDSNSPDEDLSEYNDEYALQTVATPQARYGYQRQYRRMSRPSRKSRESQKESKEISIEEEEEQKKEEEQPAVLLRGRKFGGEEEEEDEEEPILDIRPSLQTSVDILGKVVPSMSLEWQTAAVASEPPTKAKDRSLAGSVTTVKKVRKLQGHMSGILCVQFDKRRLVTGGQDRSIRIWDVRSGRSLHKFYGPKGGVRSLHFDDEILVTGSWDMLVMVWDMHQYKHISSLSGHKGCVSCVRLHPHYIVSASHDGMVRVWDRTGLPCIGTLPLHKGSITGLCLEGLHAITSASDMRVKMTHILTGQTVMRFESMHAQMITLALQDCLLIGADNKGTLYFWNKINGESEAAVKAHDAPVYKIAYHNGRIWTASGDNTVKEWDLKTMTCVRALQGHKGPVRDIKVSDDRAVTCSDDGTIRIWDFVLPKSKNSST